VCFKQNTHTHTHEKQILPIRPVPSCLSPFNNIFKPSPRNHFFTSYDSSSLLFVMFRSLPPRTFHLLCLSLTIPIPLVNQEKTHERKSLQDVRTQTLSQSLLQFFDFQFIHPNFIKLWILMDCYATSICEFCILCESPCNYYWWIFITFVIG
jgi:hypothetical protein